MGRFASALAFLAALVVVVIAAGCGQRFNGSAGEAPAPADLAANALQTLESKGSAHFVADMKTGLGTEGGFGLTVHPRRHTRASARRSRHSVERLPALLIAAIVRDDSMKRLRKPYGTAIARRNAPLPLTRLTRTRSARWPPARADVDAFLPAE